jgi:soluble lytic murein transglycosylase-like protein
MAVGPIPVGFRFYKDMIAQIADRYGLEPALVAAVVWKESDFQTNAFRFEPDFWNRYLKTNPKYRQLNPLRVSSSYGLMQVMYCRVHEDRLLDNDALPPEHLFVPEMGLNTGCAFLRELIDWAVAQGATAPLDLEAALAAYNGGRGGNHPLKDKPLRRAVYARDVLSRAAVLRREYA